MIAVIHLIDQPEVFVTSWIEALTLVTLGSILAGLATAYHHIECHAEGCHKLGRFRHGHLKLCRIHHPLVPDDGKITAEHIRRVKL